MKIQVKPEIILALRTIAKAPTRRGSAKDYQQINIDVIDGVPCLWAMNGVLLGISRAIWIDDEAKECKSSWGEDYPFRMSIPLSNFSHVTTGTYFHCRIEPEIDKIGFAELSVPDIPVKIRADGLTQECKAGEDPCLGNPLKIIPRMVSDEPAIFSLPNLMTIQKVDKILHVNDVKSEKREHPEPLIRSNGKHPAWVSFHCPDFFGVVVPLIYKEEHSPTNVVDFPSWLVNS
jgi:hypothetical protein